jgi:4-hydroxybutyryl-CoA dehydratase/vinylacetyl-CoA-Delta-isomerase
MPIRTAADYVASLKNRKLKVYLFGELVEDPVEHPVIRPSVNAVAETYRLAEEDPELASAQSSLSGRRVNRFLHVTESAGDVVQQNRMQRRLGQRTGTCFQRCVGMDAINSLFSVTYDIDRAHGTDYHARFRDFVAQMQRENFVIGGAMTDVKGDRSKAPHEQEDPDLFVRVVARRDDGVVIRGAKAHQTGCINSHWLLVMPTMRLTEADSDYAISVAVPVDHPGITYIYGRQSCDSRALEGGEIDQGNAQFGGQEALIVFDDVFVPRSHIFMNGETEFAAPLVERFTAYHRRSYVCKTGLGDVLIGAAATIADYNGASKASHVRDKLVEMAHLNETIYGAGIASSHESQPTAAGNYQCDDMLANVCKHNVTRFP